MLFKSYLMQVCKPCHYILAEVAEPFKLHPMTMASLFEMFEHLLRLWMGIWLHNHTVTTDVSQDLWELAEILHDASVQTMLLRFGWGCRTFQTVSHVYAIHIYEVFEHLLRLWMGIWLHIHKVTTADASPDLWEMAEILSDASVQTMPLRFGWGCRTSQTASHVHAIHTWEVWEHSQVVDGHMASHSHRYHHIHFPRFVRVGWNPTWCKCANHAATLCLRL